MHANPDSKVHVASIGPTWVLSSPGGPHAGPMNLAIWELWQNHPNVEWDWIDTSLIVVIKVSYKNCMNITSNNWRFKHLIIIILFDMELALEELAYSTKQWCK